MSEALPPKAHLALQQGRKIEAIKELRQAEGIGLKEAKLRVDEYIADHPELAAKFSGPPAGKVLQVVLLLGAVVAIAWYFFSG